MSKKKKAIIKLDHVSKTYSEYGTRIKALDAVSLEIYAGDFVSVIGPSGCGKSTLLNCIGLLDRASSGKVYIEGKDTSKISGKEIAKFRGGKLGFVFQNYNLIPRLTVMENVILPGLIMEKEPDELKKKAHVLLEEVDIEHRVDHKGVHLSGGEQQKVSIARALINDPVLVLADEPTGALDSKNSKEIMKLLVKLNEDRKVTFVLVSHDMSIAKYGKRKIMLKDGRIVKDSDDNLKKIRKR